MGLNMKKIKLLKTASNITMGIGVAIAIYYFYNVFISRQNLPEGACPYTDFRAYAIVGCVFLVISLILDIVKGSIIKKSAGQSEQILKEKEANEQIKQETKEKDE
jgi:hypothetical protein